MISFETFLLLNGETLKCYSFFEHVLTYYISKKLINIFYGKYGKYYNIEICSCEELSVENLFYSKSINFGDSTEKKANYKKKQNYINDEYNTTDRKSNHFNICKNDKYVKNHITHNICKNYNCHENMLYYQEYKELYNAPEVIWNYYLLKILYFLYHIHLKRIKKKKKKKCKYDKEKTFCSFCTYIISLLHYENNIIKNKDKLLFLFLFFFYFTNWNLNNLINKKYRYKKLLYHDVYYHHYNNIKKKKKKHINIKYCKDLYEEAIITHFYKLKYLDIQKLYNNHFFHIHIYREKKKKPILIICKKSLYFFNHIYLNYLRIYNYSNPISFNTEKKKIIKSNYQIKCINSFKELKMFNIKDYTLLYIILKYYDINNNNNNRKQNNTFEILYILLKKIITQRYFSNNLQFLFKSFFSINRFNFIPTLIKQYLIHFIYKFFYCHHEKKKKFPYVLPSLTCNPLMLKFEYVKRCAITTTNIKKIGNRTKLQAATIKKKKPTTVITTYRMITYNCKREKKNLYIKLIYYTTLCVYISLLHNNNYYNFYYILVHILKKIKSDIFCQKIHHFLNELAKIDPKCQYIWNAKKMFFFIYLKMYINKSKFIFQKYKRKMGKKKKKLHTYIFPSCNKINVKEVISKKKSYKYYLSPNKLLSFQNISNIKDYMKEKTEWYNKNIYIYIYINKRICKNIYKVLNVHNKNNNFIIWKYTPIHFKYTENYIFDLYAHLENKMVKYIHVNFDFFIKILECKTYNYMAASHVFTFYNILSYYLFDIKKKKKREKNSYYIPFQNKSIKYMFITKYKNVLHKNLYYYAFHYIFLLLYIKKIYSAVIFYLEKYFHVIRIKNMFTYHLNWLAPTENTKDTKDTKNTKNRNRNKEKKDIIKNNYITILYKMCINDQHIINCHLKDKKYSNNMKSLHITQNQNYDEIIKNNSDININQCDNSFYYDIYTWQRKNIRNIHNSYYHIKNIIKNNHVLYVYSTYLQFFLLWRKKKKKNYEDDNNQTYLRQYNVPLFLYKKLKKFSRNYKIISNNMIKLLNEYYSENCYIHIYSTTFRNIIYCLCNYNFFICQLFYNLIFPLLFITNNYQATSSGKEQENKYLYTHKNTCKLFVYYDNYFAKELKYMRKYYNIIKMKYKGQTTIGNHNNNNNNNIYVNTYTTHSFNSSLKFHNQYVKKKKYSDNVLFLINEKYQKKKKKWICNHFHIYSINNDMINYTTTSTHYSILISYNKMQTKKKEKIKNKDGIIKSYHKNKTFEYIYFKNYCHIFFKCIINLIHENCLYLYHILKKYYTHNNSKDITIFRAEKKFVHMDHYDNISKSTLNLKECCNFLYKIYLDIFQFFKILKQKNFNFFYVLRVFAIDSLKKKKKNIYFLKFFFSIHFLIFLCEYTYIFSSLKEIYKILKFVFNKKFYIPINTYIQRNSF
ncbi:hypothetical protein PFTANZ_00484 [Plasmodium falciparum Tanzania (2000708)]|uniref:Uncharacterized protein n=1 Tax=Plasmodium falciparum Tanzania (2000708) TaxID=1036725 RepID=A0A024WE40_PLAFA|nr:hypothetical protein PFTANZ_00484 [Plasmodium falciparum Tanzania (2000708)]